MKNKVILVIFIILAILHQDFWNWGNSNIVLGFMPVGLAYHAGYSLVCAAFWACIIKFAWPTDLEKWANEGEDAS